MSPRPRAPPWPWAEAPPRPSWLTSRLSWSHITEGAEARLGKSCPGTPGHNGQPGLRESRDGKSRATGSSRAWKVLGGRGRQVTVSSSSCPLCSVSSVGLHQPSWLSAAHQSSRPVLRAPAWPAECLACGSSCQMRHQLVKVRSLGTILQVSISRCSPGGQPGGGGSRNSCCIAFSTWGLEEEDSAGEAIASGKECVVRKHEAERSQKPVRS